MRERRHKLPGDNIHGAYISDIRKYDKLEDDEIRKCISVYRNGGKNDSKEALEKLVNGLQHFILSIVRKFPNKGDSLDLVNEGNIGLMRAADKYDINSDVKFTTYATYWVRKMIIDYITLKKPILVPNNATKLSVLLPRVRKDFWNEKCRNPTTEEIQEILISRYKIRFSHKEDLSCFQPMSLDDDTGGQEGNNDTKPCIQLTADCDTDKFAKEHDIGVITKHILNSLNKRDNDIICRIYGIGGSITSAEAIGNEYGITGERVRQIAASAIRRLKKKYHRLNGTF